MRKYLTHKFKKQREIKRLKKELDKLHDEKLIVVHYDKPVRDGWQLIYKVKETTVSDYHRPFFQGILDFATIPGVKRTSLKEVLKTINNPKKYWYGKPTLKVFDSIRKIPFRYRKYFTTVDLLSKKRRYRLSLANNWIRLDYQPVYIYKEVVENPVVISKIEKITNKLKHIDKDYWQPKGMYPYKRSKKYNNYE